MKKINGILITLFIFISFEIHSENIFNAGKSIYINEIYGWNNLDDYLKKFKRFKNYRIVDSKEKTDLELTVIIKKINFIIIDFDNKRNFDTQDTKTRLLESGGAIVEGGGVISRQKSEQTVKITYEIEMRLSNGDKSDKLVVFSDSLNIWFENKKMKGDEVQGMEHELYDSINKYDEDKINKSFDKYGMLPYKERILTDMAKKIAARLISEI
jgi:hypothetical protein